MQPALVMSEVFRFPDNIIQLLRTEVLLKPKMPGLSVPCRCGS